MSAATSPVVAAWELAVRLREQRKNVGVNVSTITDTLGFTRNYWSAVENQRKILSEESLIEIIRLLKFDAKEQRDLLELRKATKNRGWWMDYSDIIDDDVQRLFGLEAGASTILSYESSIFPGLLQTADYARALMADVTIREVEVEQRVEVRMRRQQRLDDEEPLRFVTLISEAALRQQVGGPTVLRNQLEHLVDLTKKLKDTLDLRILPFSVSACGLFGAGTVHLLEFESSILDPVIWQETVTSWGFVDTPTKVRDLDVVHRNAYKLGLSREESIAMIKRNIEDLI